MINFIFVGRIILKKYIIYTINVLDNSFFLCHLFKWKKIKQHYIKLNNSCKYSTIDALIEHPTMSYYYFILVEL